MQHNPQAEAMYSRAAIGTRSFHRDVSLAQAGEDRDVPRAEGTMVMRKVHNRRRTEGTVLSHFTVPTADRVWEMPTEPPRARIDRPLWQPPEPSGIVTVDFTEDDRRILPFDDPVWERAGK
eukprot:1380175-Rhodomonas_salina.1